MVKAKSAFNAILAWPFIHGIKAFPSSYHQCMQYLANNSFAKIKGQKSNSCMSYKKQQKILIRETISFGSYPRKYLGWGGRGAGPGGCYKRVPARKGHTQLGKEISRTDLIGKEKLLPKIIASLAISSTLIHPFSLDDKSVGY